MAKSLSLAEFKHQLQSEGLTDWPLGEESPDFEQFWCFELKASRGEVWRHISDTSRFNRELGLAPRQQVEVGGRVEVTTTVMGLKQKWIEQPWAWLFEQTIASRRTYLRGMAKSVHAVFHIEDASDVRRVYIYFGWITRNLVWRKFLQLTDKILRNNFAATFAKIDRQLAAAPSSKANVLRKAAPELNESSAARISTIRASLHSLMLNPLAVDRLIEHVIKSDDLDLDAVRLIPLAENWGLSLRDLLVAALHATRLGLLNLSWDVICPHCRGSRFTAGSLGEIPESSNCESCEVEFSTSGHNAIEIVFHVHPSIRKIEKQIYCASEPAKKNHILMQKELDGGTQITVRPELANGSFRARWIGASQSRIINVTDEGGARTLEVFADQQSAEVKPGVDLVIKNESSRSLVFVLEELRWRNQSLQPGQVLSLPEFRDLFAEEHLSSNVKISLGEQTIVFTDIVASTKFYREVGDAKAFEQVRHHFQEIYQEVISHGGVVVKTIGDAVMAAFGSTGDAFSAMVAVQRRFHAGRSDTLIRLRVSIHTGPVIAVHLATGIDYFGATVNEAAKIQSCAGAYEIAVSEEAFRKLPPETSYPIERRRNHRDGADPAEIHVVKVGDGQALKLAA